MTEINLSPNDQKDILELLDYALEKKQEEKIGTTNATKWDDRKYWQLRVPQLKALINGYKGYSSIYQSSMGSLTKDIERGLSGDSHY